MKRREFITLLGGAAAWSLAARAQQPARMRSIGVLMMYGETNLQGQGFVASFREALKTLGWLENHNLRIDYRWATAEKGLIDRFAKELTALNPEVILSSSTPTTAALLQQTRTLPIVFANIVDPIGSGFVTSLARPGGNVTGFLNFEFSMGGKWLELLKEIAPRVTRVTAIFNPTTAPYAETYLSHFKSAARAVKKEISSIPVVMIAVGDPVSTGIVSNLRQPSGNITGLSLIAPELEAKRLELLREVVPNLSHIAVLWNPSNAYQVLSENEIKAVPTVNPKRLTGARESVDTSVHERHLQVDLVRVDRTVAAAGCARSRNPCSPTPAQCAAAQIPETSGPQQH